MNGAFVAIVAATSSKANDRPKLPHPLYHARGRTPQRSPPSLRMAQWDDLAKDYEVRVEPVTCSFVEEMLEPFRPHRTGVAPKLLDVGCGTGGASLRAKKLGFTVTAADISPPMVGRSAERCGDDMECVVTDGQSLPSEWTGAFDCVMSSFSVIFFDDPLRGVEEMRRCLIPSGKAVISAWGDRSDSPAFRIIPDAVRDVAPELVGQGVKKHVISSPSELLSLMEQAGFEDVQVKGPVTRTLILPTPTEYFNRFALQSPPTLAMISWMKENIENDTVDKFRERVIQLAVERGGGQLEGPVQIVSPAYFAYGTKPS